MHLGQAPGNGEAEAGAGALAVDVGIAALEEGLVGEHGERRRSSGLQRGREGGHGETRADNSFGGRRLLELGDDAVRK